MKTITLAGAEYKSIDDFYSDIATQLQFPAQFAHNLESLEHHLSLVAGVEPVTIHWKNYGHARYVFGVSELGVAFLPAILNILSEAKGVTLMLE